MRTYLLSWLIILCLPVCLCAQAGKELHTLRLHKLAPGLQAMGSFKATSVRVKVKNADAATSVQSQLGNLARLKSTGSPHIFLVYIFTEEALALLLNSDEVEYVDVANRTAHTERRLPSPVSIANQIALAHSYFPYLQGKNLTVSIKENPFNSQDIDFKGRVISNSLFEATQSAHATDIATVVAGAGNSGPSGKGVAWQAKLATSSFSNLMPDHLLNLLATGVSVQNHSYGVGLENYYGLEAEAYDRQCLELPTLVHVFSSGNQGINLGSGSKYNGIAGYANLTGQFKLSKNTLTVGATDASGRLSALSSKGPAYDGRIKPEITAQGIGGTSEAAAIVSGISLLLQQAYQLQHHTLPPASLVKAALINSAEDRGMPGPDFGSGYGSVNAMSALTSIHKQTYFYDSLGQNDFKVFTIHIPMGMPYFKVTLVWHDVAGNPTNSHALVNDLDLELTHTTTGQTWHPWILNSYPHPDSLALPARRGIDRINNVEQVSLASPEGGQYEVKVKTHGLATNAQAFSLVYEYNKSFTWIYPAKESFLKAGVVNSLQWHGKPSEGTVEYSIAGSERWLEVTDGSGNTGSATWLTPDTTAPMLLRYTHQGQSFVSDTFFVYKPISMKVGFTCETKALFYWPSQKGAQSYQVYRLEEAFMEPLVRTSDTTILLPYAKNQVQYYAVAPVLQHQEFARGPAQSDNSLDTDCYFVSFVPRQYVADTVDMHVQLSSLYDLQSAHLERFDKGTFHTISSLEPLRALQFNFRDLTAAPGVNYYRVKLLTTNGTHYYSTTEKVIYKGKSEALVFPNPIRQGEELQLIEGRDEALNYQVHDLSGKLLFTSQDTGMVKIIPTQKLKKGTYLLIINTTQGLHHTRRILVY